MASGQEVSLSLHLWIIAKIQAGGTLDSVVTGISIRFMEENVIGKCV